MSQFRFIDNSLSLTEGEQIEIKNERIVHQLTKVLRAKVGQNIELCDGKLTEAEAEIVDIDKKSVSVDVRRVYQNTKEPHISVGLFCAILKKDNFEWVVEKATEVGVKEITPITTERIVKFNLKIERLEKIALEAAEQSGRGAVPDVREPASFEEVVEQKDEEVRRIFFHGWQERRAELLTNAENFNSNEKTEIFIGPEGGWSELEMEMARSSGMEFKSLGDLTLRAETAAIVSSYFVVNSK